MKPAEIIKFLSVMLYLLEKLGFHQYMIDLCENFMSIEEIMMKCNPFSLFYILEDTKFNQKLYQIHRMRAPFYDEVKQRFFEMRALIKQHWLNNPTCFFFDDFANPAMCDDPQWVEAASYFIEAIQDNLICVRAIQVEKRDNFKKFFGSRTVLMRTSFEDRVQLFLSKDLDEETQLTDMWPI